MLLLCATAIFGGGLTAVGAWSSLGLGALLAAPFGGSLGALGAALVIAHRREGTPLVGRDWVKDLQAETHVPAANDLLEAHQGERRHG